VALHLSFCAALWNGYADELFLAHVAMILPSLQHERWGTSGSMHHSMTSTFFFLLIAYDALRSADLCVG
jgi:hypothetical protein